MNVAVRCSLALGVCAAVLAACTISPNPSRGPESARETSPPVDGLECEIRTRRFAYSEAGGRALHVTVHTHCGHGAAPARVFVHGGGWSRGAPPPASEFTALLASGTPVVAVEYRLAAEAPAPAAVRDVRCALGWLGRHASELGFATDRIVVEGASAGGHLALLAVLAQDDPEFDAGCGPLPTVLAVVDRYGITDLSTWHPPSGAVARWLGPRAGDVAYMRRLSPINRLHRGAPPLFVVHGDADRVVPPTQSRALVAAARALGVPAMLQTVAGGGHGGFDAATEARLESALRDFIQAPRPD